LGHEAPFLTAQFFKLAQPVAEPYSGARQGQTGLGAIDIEELSQTEGLTLGEMVKTLGTLAHDVAELRGSVSKLTWLIPLIVGIGLALVTIIVALK
jgi:hypothetical protein